MKQWWCGSPKVEPFMNDVRSAIARHLPNGAAQVDIYNRAYEAVYTALQSIETTRDWTPCAEGLPEDAPGFSSMSRYECTILIPDGTREVFTLHRTGNGRWLYETGKGLDAVRVDQVIAWRKVPDPYNPDHIREATKKVDPDDVSQWPDWKKRAALGNYELGKED